MRRSNTFTNCFFNPETLLNTVAELEKLGTNGSGPIIYDVLLISDSKIEESWNYDSITEFLNEYAKFHPKKHKYSTEYSAEIWLDKSISSERRVNFYFRHLSYNDGSKTSISVSDEDRNTINSIMRNFIEAEENSRHHPPETSSPIAEKQPRIFIGHGRNDQWRDLKDHLADKHGYEVQAYESGAREGHVIRDILEDMKRSSDFALLVLTGEDETAEGKFNPRLNVVHETGLFQGFLGFPRAIMLLEEECEDFSNVHGIQQIRFRKNAIRETFGDVLALLKREFG